ncbi:GerMN domain-containing protein [Vampirovibrio sp.]|uniref:GerMN domain-containing protein n=1 Tax=Vampirovibrio sp. TaxID=2717857 RepID=UPI00359345F1
MPAASSQNRFTFYDRYLTAGVLLLLLSAPSMMLSGCGWFNPPPAPKPLERAAVDQAVVAVYFSKYQGSRSIVEDVIRKVPETAKAEQLQFALSELLKGPSVEEKSQGFYTEIPAGTKLIAVHQEPKRVRINLSQPFSGGGGSTSMTQRLEELKRTVKAVDAEREVIIEVDGKPLELLGGEGLEVPGSMQGEPQ